MSLVELLEFRVGPVSYTHLDVYKRQTNGNKDQWKHNDREKNCCPRYVLAQYKLCEQQNDETDGGME